MIFLLVIINTSILFLLSFLHIYWAFGGRWGWESTLPTRENGEFLFHPGIAPTLIVAFGLLAFGVVTLGNLDLFAVWIPVRYFHYATWAVAAVFALRAIGDFNYVGFFKKVTHTQFATSDSRIYSPLCVLLSSGSVLIAIFSLRGVNP
ncbi:MAG: DUF3995 domain-containing protein [Bacteroidetes bacterium]|nr:DUF3995 domain-containing protein [Bacteroidota bacterium]